MDTNTIVDDVISFIEDNYDTYKSSDLPSLMKVYKGDPYAIEAYPSIAVHPVRVNRGKSAQTARYRTEFELDVYFYAYEIFEEFNIERVLKMGKALEDLIKSDQKLNNTVSLISLDDCEYGIHIKKGVSGETTGVMGGVQRINILVLGTL